MAQSNPPLSPRDLGEGFIKVTFEEEAVRHGSGTADPFYEPWTQQASAKFSDPAVFGASQLRKLHANHSIVCANDSNVNLLGFPGAVAQPVSPTDLITTVYFYPLARRLSQIPGVLVNSISFGSFHVAWEKYDFLVYIVKYPYGFGTMTQHYILHEGPEEPSRALLVAAGAWHAQLHEEILVFNSGSWQKDHDLWVEVQKANWADVILKDEFKANFKKDIYGFFDSEALYKSLAIPWKRGLIMYGPPGNGKTISMKAVMKDCDAKGYAPLYVKSFKSWMGEEGSMQAVFDKARQMAPCVVVLEDLDSLINNANRSFFLNQLDGLSGNDGLLLIGSTNHFDQLDPALNNRPSRFDRKYLFDDPDREERTLYVQYWQNKLKNNENISFPDSLVEEVAERTDGFSFAYLKEAFVSTLVLMAGYDGDDKPDFGTMLKTQVKTLRDQLDKNKGQVQQVPPAYASSQGGPSSSSHGFPNSLPNIDQRSIGQPRIWDTTSGMTGHMPGALPVYPGQHMDPSARRAALRDMAVSLGRSFLS